MFSGIEHGKEKQELMYTQEGINLKHLWGGEKWIAYICLYYGFNVIFNTGIMVLKLVLIEKHDEIFTNKIKKR